jgi:hypothetical protein
MLVVEYYKKGNSINVRNIVFKDIENGRNYIHRWCDCDLRNENMWKESKHECGKTVLAYDLIEYFDIDEIENKEGY